MVLDVDSVGSLLHPGLFVRKAVGKLRRKTIRFPDIPVTTLVNGTVQFEHKRLPFLTEDNQLAMMTGSCDIMLQDFLRKHLRPGDTVIDGGANAGYISAVAASNIGRSGEVHRFEPLPQARARMART